MVQCVHCGDDHGEGVDFCPKTGRPVTDIVQRMLGRTIADRYHLTRCIGQGGMGTIFEAEHTLIGSKVAVKLLHETFAAEQEPVQRLYREARASGAIGHPNIIQIHDVGKTGEGAPFLVMELLEGVSLGEHIDRTGPQPIRFTLDVAGQMLSALHAAHRAGIIHRDLKSDNVFLLRTDDGSTRIKILDFGISKNLKSDAENLALTQTGTVLGTPLYMSPEQASGRRDLDHRIDLYSAGVILYECLLGMLPHSASNYNALLSQIITQDVQPFRDARPDVPGELEAIVLRALSRRREDRWQSAVDFSEAIQVVRRSLPFDVLNGPPAIVRASRPRDSDARTTDVGEAVLKAQTETPLVFEKDDARPPGARRRKRMAVGIAAALAVVIAAAAAAYVSQPGDEAVAVQPPPPSPPPSQTAEDGDAGAPAAVPPPPAEGAAPEVAAEPVPAPDGQAASRKGGASKASGKKGAAAGKRPDGAGDFQRKASTEVGGGRAEKKGGLDTPMDNPF